MSKKGEEILMSKFLQSITTFSSDKKGSKIIVLLWIVLAFLLASVAPGAKEYSTNKNGSDLPNDAKSVIADKKLKQYFKNDSGLPALLVFKQKNGITNKSKKEIGHLIDSISISKNYPNVKDVIPYSTLPSAVQDSLLSKDKDTLVAPVMLKDNIEMHTINDTIRQFKKEGKKELSKQLKLYVTGPAGIASDTLELFSNADFVLLFSTVGIILILLIFIYRSPLLALIPLIISGIVYEVVDKVIGLAGKQGMRIESQSLSIMMILLFAAITDYSLFVFSRYREELKVNLDKYSSMKKAMKSVGEPIFFSAGTVLAAMLILFTAVYKPYQNFAPVFSIAMAIILIAGITLVPAFFTLFGRKAFWPSIPKYGEKKNNQKGIWSKVANFVTKKPLVSGGIVLILLVVSALNMTTIKYSFNLIKSFPEDLESRVGFEILEDSFTKGDLAPTDILLTIDKKGDITQEKVNTLLSELGKQKEVDKVTIGSEMDQRKSSPEDYFLEKNAIKLKLTFKNNPYEIDSLDALDHLRDTEKNLLNKSNLSAKSSHLYFAGETAKQADVRNLNDRDTSLTVVLITALILILLIVQTRSVVAPIYMIATILISYTSAMGISQFIFDHFLDMHAMSYRIPLYAFVFLVALGVDYNIMLMSRIKEELKTYDLKTAVQRGVTLTGGVISSAGLILAATFGVLMTQPILELFMFGFVVAIGVLIDTFIVRGILVPAIVLLIGKWNFWPRKLNTKKIEKG